MAAVLPVSCILLGESDRGVVPRLLRRLPRRQRVDKEDGDHTGQRGHPRAHLVECAGEHLPNLLDVLPVLVLVQFRELVGGELGDVCFVLVRAKVEHT